MSIDFTPDTLAKMIARAAEHVNVRKFNTREAKLATTIAAGLGGTSPITAVGDLIVGTGVGTETNLPVGTNGQVLQSNGTNPVWTTPANYKTHGVILSLSAASAGTVTIPANTLQAGDFVEVFAGETTDGSSTSATIELDMDAVSLATISDTNTAAHQWGLSARLYYNGTNFLTVDASASSTGSSARFSGASNAASAASSHTLSIKTDAHATKGAMFANIFRP